MAVYRRIGLAFCCRAGWSARTASLELAVGEGSVIVGSVHRYLAGLAASTPNGR
jgi:hypothetical protein